MRPVPAPVLPAGLHSRICQILMHTHELNGTSSKRPMNKQMMLLGALAFVILFMNLGKGDLSGYDDAFHAVQGRTMLYSGNYLTVTFNGIHNPEFPPLFYWFEAASMKLWGVNDFAAKFPSALLGFGTIVAVYFIARQLTGQVQVALISMAALMSTKYFMKYATHAMTDVPFAFFVTLSVLFCVIARNRPVFFLASGLAVGLAMLTRPFVGVLPLGLLVTHLLLTNHKDAPPPRISVAAVSIAIALPLLWYGIQFRLHGIQSIYGPGALFFRQMTSRKMPGMLPILIGLLEYPWLLLKLYWFWLPFVAIGLCPLTRKAITGKEFGPSLLVLWVAWFILPMSFGSAKQLRYVMPVFPAFAVIIAIQIHPWFRKERWELFLRAFYCLAVAAVPILFLFPGTLMRATDMRKLAPIASSYSAPNQRLVLYTSGSYQWNYINQLLWYSDRLVDFCTTLDLIQKRIAAEPDIPIILDKDSFAIFNEELPNRGLQILGESEKFICFRGNPAARTLP